MRAARAWGRALAAGTLLLGARPARAHRLDEYLEATTLAVGRGRIAGQLRLAPGVAVVPAVLALIDADRDGTLSAGEQRAYAARVLGEVRLAVDGDPLPLRLVDVAFPSAEAMREGRGEILIRFEAAVPGGGGSRQLTFENRHQPRIAAYLVNALAPDDPAVRITGQRRNYEQSTYQLDYTQAGAAVDPLAFLGASGVGAWMGAVALLPLAGLALVWQGGGVRARRARAR